MSKRATAKTTANLSHERHRARAEWDGRYWVAVPDAGGVTEAPTKSPPAGELTDGAEVSVRRSACGHLASGLSTRPYLGHRRLT